MHNAIKIAVALTATVLVGGTGYTAVTSWRHSMPEFVIDVRTADAGDKTPNLLLIYGEKGSDPFHEGGGRSDIRVADCKTRGSLCVSRVSRMEYLPGVESSQSLQVRLFTGNGNPIIGGVRWFGSWHPDRVRVTCDLRLADARKACAVSKVTP
ncbi:hypothetical protein [Sphingomonas sp. S-NIH.Pt15_0812]|uniref:hypothetical protein n=1 Tax=Sphingomonas sp. S-NIH.Pt15_0812 TaxID=1920129 RepID=UPI000F7DF423|nr:hypothetical protein [Sphingomonas sp. S-NIH.Pt15_0812]